MEKEIPAKKFSKPSRKKIMPKKEIEAAVAEEITDLEVAKKMMKIFQSAADRSLEFNLSFVTVKKLLTYDVCYYTGKAFEEEGLFSRSFDRVDSSKGYVEGNVVACTVDINGKKSNLSVEEIIALYNRLAPKPPTPTIQLTHEHVKREDHGRDLDGISQIRDSSTSTYSSEETHGDESADVSSI
jgi:hypothetical protein